MKMINAQESLIKETAALLKTQPVEILKRIEIVLAESKSFEKRIEAQNAILAKSMAQTLLNNAIDEQGLKLIFAIVETSNADELRNLADKVRDFIQDGVVILASVHGDKVSIVAMATKSAIQKGAHAGNIIKEAARIAGGGGGGRPDMAQAGGKDIEAICAVIDQAKITCMQQLKDQRRI